MADVDSFINLIKSLRENSQDDTDPANILIQQFQAPYEEMGYGETISLLRRSYEKAWAGYRLPQFSRNSLAFTASGGSYVQSNPGAARFDTGPLTGRQSLFAEESTTQLLANSDINVCTGTATMLVDPMINSTLWYNTANYSYIKKNLLTANQSNAESAITNGVDYVPYNSATVTRDTTQYWQGVASFGVTTPGTVVSEGTATPSVDVTAGQTYTASVYVKGTGTITVTIHERDSSDVYITGTSSSVITLTGSWQRVSVTRTFGSTGVKSRILVTTNSVQAITYNVDGLMLEQSSTMSPYWVLGGRYGARANTSAVVNWATLNSYKPQKSTSTGSNLSVTAQVTIIAGGIARLFLVADSSNYYYLYVGTNGAVTLNKTVNGTSTSIKSGFSALPWTTGSLYTLTLSYDANTLAGLVYSGTDTTTLMGGLTVVDTVHSGKGFTVGVSGDIGTVFSDAKVTAPKPDNWNISYNSATYPSLEVTYLAGQGYNGTGALSMRSINKNGGWLVVSNNITTTDGTNYTWGFWAKADAATTCLVKISNGNGQNAFASTTINITTSWQFFTATGACPAGGSAVGEQLYLYVGDGTTRMYISCAQVEAKAGYLTSHVTNNTTSSLARAADDVEIPVADAFTYAEGTFEFWVKPTIIFSWHNSFNMNMDIGRFLFWITSTGDARFDYGAVNSSAIKVAAASANTWMHIALTWSAMAGTRTLYVNGVPAQTVSFVPPDPTTLPSTFPLHYSGSAYYADFRSSCRARTDAEILAGYQSGAPLPVDRDTIYKMDLNGDLFDRTYDVAMFDWDVGGKYEPDLEVYVCLMLI